MYSETLVGSVLFMYKEILIKHGNYKNSCIYTRAMFMKRFYHPQHPMVVSRIRRGELFYHQFQKSGIWNESWSTFGPWQV